MEHISLRCRHEHVVRAVHADVEERLELHCAMVAQDDFLLHLLALENLAYLAHLHEEVFRKQAEGALFGHKAPAIGCRSRPRGQARRP